MGSMCPSCASYCPSRDHPNRVTSRRLGRKMAVFATGTKDGLKYRILSYEEIPVIKNRTFHGHTEKETLFLIAGVRASCIVLK